MTREEESWQKQLQRNRDEMRRLKKVQNITLLALAAIGLVGIALLLAWGLKHAVFDILAGLPQ